MFLIGAEFGSNTHFHIFTLEGQLGPDSFVCLLHEKRKQASLLLKKLIVIKGILFLIQIVSAGSQLELVTSCCCELRATNTCCCCYGQRGFHFIYLFNFPFIECYTCVISIVTFWKKVYFF